MYRITIDLDCKGDKEFFFDAQGLIPDTKEISDREYNQLCTFINDNKHAIVSKPIVVKNPPKIPGQFYLIEFRNNSHAFFMISSDKKVDGRLGRVERVVQ